ncbi:MAG: RNA polymerase sigma factor [Caldilineaceae bacterium]
MASSAANNYSRMLNRSGTQELTPHALVQACLRGDARAWNALLERYMRLVYSVGVRHGLYAVEVEDMAQETFAALAQALPTISDAEALPAWLMTTARRLCWRAVQKRRRELLPEAADLGEGDLPGSAVPLFTTMPSMDEMSAEWQRQEALAAGLARLGERCRVLLTMLFLEREEPSYDTISATTGIPKGSIGPTRTRCLQQLRSILEGLGVEGADG